MEFRFLADENFHAAIVRGLRRRKPNINLLRVQDVGLRLADDPEILRWAASEQRILLTHDRATMSDFAYERVQRGEPMPGVFMVRSRLSVGEAIDEIVLVMHCSQPQDWNDQVIYLPL